MVRMMRIFIVEDHAIFKEGLIKILNNQPGYEVVGTSNSSGDIYSKLSALNIDLIILGCTFAGKFETDIIDQLKNNFPKTKVLILCEHSSHLFALRFIKAGASGFISKKIIIDEFMEALIKIKSGQKYIESNLSSFIVANSLDKNSILPHEKLSNREMEVLRLIANGKKISKIAADLSLSINTISTYKSRIFEKLNMKSTAEIIRYVFEHNLI